MDVLVEYTMKCGKITIFQDCQKGNTSRHQEWMIAYEREMVNTMAQDGIVQSIMEHSMGKLDRHIYRSGQAIDSNRFVYPRVVYHVGLALGYAYVIALTEFAEENYM